MPNTTTRVTIRRANGEVVAQTILGEGEHIIGREGGVTLDEPQISRQHARLVVDEKHLSVEDLGSTSGTYLDGVKLSGRVPLRPGQKVHLGDLYLDIEREGFEGLIEGARLGQGRFTLVQKIGQGGMGEVWLGLDEQTNAYVAMKLLPPDVADNELGLRDMEREVAKTQALQHPNIVQMGGLWHQAGEPAFLALEYVDGIDLERMAKQAPERVLAWESINGYMLQLAHALEFAHAKKVAHRDIKPANLLINRRGELKLADFGIAASINTTMGAQTMEVVSAGTPSYMSPQQIEGEAPQAADDIYSMGATIYDLLTGTPPFHTGEIVHQVINKEPQPMARRLKDLGVENAIPDYVSAMVMACLQKDPTHRPPNAEAIRQWIQTLGRAGSISGGTRKLWTGTAGASVPGALAGGDASKVQPKAKKKWALAALTVGVIIGIAATAWRWSGGDTVELGNPSVVEPVPFSDREPSVRVEAGGPFLGQPTGLEYNVPELTAATLGKANKVLAIDSNKMVLLGDSNERKEYQMGAQLKAVAWHPEEKLAAVGCEDGTVKIVNLLNGIVVTNLISGSGAVIRVAIHPEGSPLYVLHNKGPEDETRSMANIWNTNPGFLGQKIKRREDRVMGVLQFYGPASAMSPEPFNPYALLLGYEDGTLQLSALDRGNVYWRKQFEHGITAAARAPQTIWFAVGSHDGILRIMDDKNQMVRAYGKANFDAGITDLAWSPDSLHILTGHSNGEIVVRKFNTGEVTMALVAHDGPVKMVDFNEDGTEFISAGADGKIKFWK